MCKSAAYICLLIGLAAGSGAEGQQRVMRLDPDASTAHLRITSSWLNLEGDFQSYTGVLRLNARDMTPLALVLDVDLARVNFQTTQTGSFQIPNLLQSIAQQKVQFESTRIGKLSAKAYAVEGVFIQGGVRRPFKTVIKQVSAKPLEAVFDVTQDGAASEIDPAVRPPFIPPDSRASFRGRLVFRAEQPPDGIRR